MTSTAKRSLELIEKKASGEEIVLQPRTEAAPKVVDLMAALEASIAAARGGKSDAKAEKSAPEREKVTAGGGGEEDEARRRRAARARAPEPPARRARRPGTEMFARCRLRMRLCRLPPGLRR